jgi:hypothetical protein
MLYALETIGDCVAQEVGSIFRVVSVSVRVSYVPCAILRASCRLPYSCFRQPGTMRLYINPHDHDTPTSHLLSLSLAPCIVMVTSVPFPNASPGWDSSLYPTPSFVPPSSVLTQGRLARRVGLQDAFGVTYSLRLSLTSRRVSHSNTATVYHVFLV